MLTQMERAVIAELVVDGAPNKIIGQRLGIAGGTAKQHLENAMRYSDTHTRTALALWWIRHGRYENPDPDPDAT